MTRKKIAAFIVFYITLIFLILITYLYVQKYHSYEATHQNSEETISDTR